MDDDDVKLDSDEEEKMPEWDNKNHWVVILYVIL